MKRIDVPCPSARTCLPIGTKLSRGCRALQGALCFEKVMCGAAGLAGATLSMNVDSDQLWTYIAHCRRDTDSVTRTREHLLQSEALSRPSLDHFLTPGQPVAISRK